MFEIEELAGGQQPAVSYSPRYAHQHSTFATIRTWTVALNELFIVALDTSQPRKHCETKNICATSPCRNGGTCTSVSDGTSYKCICPSGFKGITCADDVEECNNNPCKHGGTCLNTHGSYQ
ncbi:Neurogenic locus Notch protein [Eumeta japonica]|uniref:Neurogenic locus Notch protein n=1 Tax=Eumeta variegata TaxID=151549 RepID=A0A4C1SFP4_EUMVA|nr:Neurogenic locus Notch protein [Eumeta japonica]